MKYNSIVKCTHHKLHKDMINFSIIAKDKIYLHFLKKKQTPKDLKKKNSNNTFKTQGERRTGVRNHKTV